MAVRPGTRRSSTWLVVGAGALLFALFVVWFVVRLSNDPEARSSLGDEVFEIGDARGVANAIDRDGPLLVADPLRRGRNLVIDRDGGRWVVYAVRPSGDGCRLEVDRGTKAVVDTCTGPVGDADALPRYPARVTPDGALVVDLRTRREG